MNSLPRLNAWLNAVLLFFLSIPLLIVRQVILGMIMNYSREQESLIFAMSILPVISLLFPIIFLAICLYIFYGIMPDSQPYLSRLQRRFNPALVSVWDSVIAIGIAVISSIFAIAFAIPFNIGSALIKINSLPFLLTLFIWIFVSACLYEINYLLQEKFADTIRKQIKVNPKRT